MNLFLRFGTSVALCCIVLAVSAKSQIPVESRAKRGGHKPIVSSKQNNGSEPGRVVDWRPANSQEKCTQIRLVISREGIASARRMLKTTPDKSEVVDVDMTTRGERSRAAVDLVLFYTLGLLRYGFPNVDTAGGGWGGGGMNCGKLVVSFAKGPDLLLGLTPMGFALNAKVAQYQNVCFSYPLAHLVDQLYFEKTGSHLPLKWLEQLSGESHIYLQKKLFHDIRVKKKPAE